MATTVEIAWKRPRKLFSIDAILREKKERQAPLLKSRRWKDTPPVTGSSKNATRSAWQGTFKWMSFFW